MKKVIFVLSFLLSTLFVLSSPSNASAACNDYTNSTTCGASCGGVKSDGVTSYFCKWLSTSSSCVESTNLCGGAPSTSGICPAGTYQSGCLDHYNGTQAYCDCYSNTSPAGCSSSNYALCGKVDGVTRTCNGTYACGGTSQPPIATPTPTPTPSVPVLNPVGPIECMTSNPMPITFTWNAVAGATSYYLRIDDETSNGWIGCVPPEATPSPINPGDYCLPNITGTSYTANLVPGKTYKYWISAYINTVPGPLSTHQTLTVPNILCAPTPIGPTGTIACQANSLTYINFSWSSIPSATSYYLRLDDKSNGWVNCPVPGTIAPTPMPGDACISGITMNQYSTKLSPNRSYDWWVSAYNGSKAGVIGPHMSFTVPPTCTVATTAKCVSTNIYSPNWALISPTEYSDLSDNSQVYFCTAGSSSAGSFDMARFTINGTLYPTTTIKRPGSNDFCQLYTIPNGSYTTNVQGEIHHDTLGWL